MSQLTGKWKHDRSENLEELLAAMDVGMVMRKLAGSTSPTVDIAVADDGTWTIKAATAVKTMTSTFKLGEPFEESGPDGKKRKVASLENDVLTVKVVDDPAGAVVIREVVDGQMIMTMTKGSVTAKRIFNRA
ncbi:sodium/calcium exchanger regulatory protein 1-like [Ptychodera flava]|uniref:sodium/calcium exchanger regulatory protein 1-like n=1 Tax=Ptychodera flava TaxID=63121 RepID=UPI00396A9FBB